ncbi:ABC transporter [Mumia zhuanghuii]|uniref:Transport permease protein n=2 Tax=Mumia TaxID=1546255 RepID=A0ABW1QMP0_9ACTN|nr:MULTISPECIES: ABC transporter permease [Mumia]KAA1420629.1 ABC transporter [Mumia zhuanghuii]
MASSTVLRGTSRGAAHPTAYPLLERHVRVYKRAPAAFASGFLEPLFYLLSIGVGVAALVGEVTLDDGRTISYTAFLAPAMLATQAMNGALFDATYGFFFRLKYEKLYDAVLATPLRPVDAAVGEVLWATVRGAAYAAAFVVIMAALGLTSSWWTLLALPAALLIAFGFAAAGLALTTWMRSWQDFEFIQVAIMPMFLFSATFYPLSAYPDWMQTIVTVTPLYQAVDLVRSLTTGAVGPELLVPITYFAVMGALGLRVAGRRVGVLILR